ncbi:MAG: hypothetical protein JSU86_01815, partial [Phycisphaerales bacterium]
MMRSAYTSRLFAVVLVVVFARAPLAIAQFDNVSNWAAFDPGDNHVGTDPDGYSNAVFDGRYVYFAPWHNGTGFHAEVLRYDTQRAFGDPSAWATYDPAAHDVGVRPRGFTGAVFDNRYVYFVPWHNGVDFHGEVLRYDTEGSFTDPSSWDTYDAKSHGVGHDPTGFGDAVFDGRYIYFVPTLNNTGYHGEVLRYDTSGAFREVSSWEAFDAGAHDVGSQPDGYWGGAFDGRYVYFAPVQNNEGMHGEVLRVDTVSEFSDPGSWTTFDPGVHDVGNKPDGFVGSVFDGQYVYFVPLEINGGEHNGEVLRYDTTGVFSDVSSWAAYDAGSNGLGDSPDKFAGGVFDGRYIYFAPHSDDTAGAEEVLRYDTAEGFTDLTSWAVFDPVSAGVGSGIDGRHGGVFDGRYVYFAPSNWHQQMHG